MPELTLDQLLAGDYDVQTLSVKKVKDAYRQAKFLPFTFYTVYPGVHIQRVRAKKRYHFPAAVSYNPDPDKVEYGRANEEKNSLFYGSLSSVELEHALLTTCMESSKLVRDQKHGHQTFTVGVWKTKHGFEIPILHHPEPSADPMREKHRLALAKDIENFPQEDRERILKLQKILAREFSKRVPTTADKKDAYLLSAAFAELMYDRGFAGLAYPSVETDGKGQNVALLPRTVERCLKPNGAQLVQFHWAGNDSFRVCQHEMAYGKHYPYRWVKMHPQYAFGMDFIEDGE